MASRQAILELHRTVGKMPANQISDRLKRWYRNTGIILARGYSRVVEPRRKNAPGANDGEKQARRGRGPVRQSGEGEGGRGAQPAHHRPVAPDVHGAGTPAVDP